MQNKKNGIICFCVGSIWVLRNNPAFNSVNETNSIQGVKSSGTIEREKVNKLSEKCKTFYFI